MSSAKRTQPRTWRTQYSGSVNSSPASRPVTFDAIGIAGALNVKPAQTWRNSSSIGSIRAEWNAWLTRNRRVRRSADQRASSASTASASPETTTACSALTAARRHPVVEGGGDFGFGGLDGEHRPTGGQLAHQPAPRLHQPGRVRQRQHPGHVRGRDLAHRMAHQELRCHAERLDQPEQRRPRPRTTRAGCSRSDPGRCQARTTSRVAHLVDRRAEHRERVVQGPAHPGPLRPLATEHHRRTARPHQRPAPHRPAPRHRSPPRAPRQVRPARGQLETDIPRRHLGVPGHMGREPRRLSDHRRLGPTRHQPRHHRQRRQRRLGGRHDRRRLLHDHVRIRPAEAERRHTRPAGPLPRHPRLGAGQQADLTGRPVDVRRRLVRVQRARAGRRGAGPRRP